MNTNETTPAKQYEPNALLRAGAYGLAVAAGVATASFKVWDQFYSKIKHTKVVEKFSDDRYKEINKVHKQANKHGMAFDEVRTKIADIEQIYSKQVDTFLAKEGIASEGLGVIKGTIQRFQLLGPYTRANIAFTGAAAIGTTLGAYFLINQNLKLKHELHNVHDRLNETSR